MELEFGSICSGIEAASVAWAPMGWKAAWLAEVDVAASQVLSHRLGATAPIVPLPGTEKAIARLAWRDRLNNYGDMTALPTMVRSGQVSAPALLCGGTPCQAFSIAGRREGMKDPRGGLTLSFVDLADAIDERRLVAGDVPCIVYWENVPGVLSDAENAFGCFLAALAGDDAPVEPGPRPEPSRSSAFWTWDKKTGQHRAKWPDAGVVAGPQRAIAWRVSDAQYFGLAQRRRRVVVVGSACEGFDPAAILLEFEGMRRDSPPSRETWEEVAGTLDARTDGGGFPGSDGAAAYHVVPHGLGVSEHEGFTGVVPTWWDGSPVSQTLDAVLHKGQTMPEKNRFPAVLQPVAEAYSIMPMNSGKDPIGGNQGGDFVVQSVALRGRDGGAAAELGDDLAFALRASEGGGDKPHVLAPIPLNPNVLRGGEALTPSPDSKGRVRLRNPSFGVGQPGDPADTLTAAGPGMIASVHGTQDPDITVDFAHTLGRNNGQENALFCTTMAVRRLMPIECHRLQGFPDDWCAVPIGNRIAADGPQYKQLGNSWAVNHARWVGYRINAWFDRQTAASHPFVDLLE